MTDSAKDRQPPPRLPTEGAERPPATGVTDGNLTRAIELRDFMEQLGWVMRLPRRKGGKAPTGESAPAAAAPSTTTAERGTWWGPLALLGAVAFVAYLGFRSEAGSDPLPPAAVGRWITNDARYVERGFALDSASIVFYTGSEQADYTRHSIVGTTVTEENGNEVVSLDYVLGDGTATLKFWIQPGGEPVIHFLNQPEIAWRRGFWPGR
jgi:hypothetical protein